MALVPFPERKYVPGEGLTYDPQDFFNFNNPATAPTPQISPKGISTATGIDPQAVAASLYGDAIAVFAGGKMRFGGRFIEGPFFGGSEDNPTVSYIASFAMCANPTGTRTITEFSLRGRIAWTLVDGALLSGLNVEFRTGSETQLPFAASVSRYGSSAIAYRPHILCCVTDLPLSTFAGIVPFPSVMVEDSTFGDPADGITRNDALETILRYAGLADDEFEVDVGGNWDFAIIPDKIELLPFLQSLRKIYVNWNITVTDKIRIIEPPAFSIDFSITRDNHIARSMKFTRVEPLTKPREKIFKFIDPARDYEQNSATARQELWPFPTTASIESETIALPVGMDAAQAMVDVNYALYQSEVARKQLDCVGMISLLGAEAGDGTEFSDHDFFRFRGRVVETVKNAADWTIDIKAETWLNCNVPAAPVVSSWINHYEQVGVLATQEFAGVALGAAAADRLIVIIAGSGRTNNRTINAARLDGVPMTPHQSIHGIGTPFNDPALAIFSLVVPTGTTATIEVDYSGVLGGSFIDLYRLTDYQSATPHDSDTSSVTGSNPLLHLDIPAGGTIIAGYVTHGSGLSGVTWTGVAIEDSDLAMGSDLQWGSAAHESGLASQSGRIISVNGPSTGRELLVAASWPGA